MEVSYDGKIYITKYVPFFRIKRMNGYQIFGLRYPSGYVERVFIIDDKRLVFHLKEYLTYLIKEYVVEDREALTPYAKRLKDDIHELFGLGREAV